MRKQSDTTWWPIAYHPFYASINLRSAVSAAVLSSAARAALARAGASFLPLDIRTSWRVAGPNLAAVIRKRSDATKANDFTKILHRR